MSNVIVSQNMLLPVPVPGVDPGPDYANNLNSSLNIIDGHNHSPGSGVQINPMGLNINSNLNIQGNQLTNVYGVLFSAPASSSQTTFLYTAPQSGGGVYDLYYNDGAGNVIPLTKAGVVNSTASSIPGESYSAGTFTWKQGAGSTTPANFDIGSITIRPNVSSTTYGITVSPPSGISSAYSLVLPALPSATSIMQLDNSGNITASLTVDNATIVISSNMLTVGTIQSANLAAGSVGTSALAANAVTNAKIASSVTSGTLLNSVTFTYTGSTQTWTVPAGVKNIIAVGCGGGGGGAGGQSASNPGYGGGGGGGAPAFTIPMSVTAGNTLNIVIGNGGSGGSGANPGGAGSSGGTTTFNGFAFYGGNGAPGGGTGGAASLVISGIGSDGGAGAANGGSAGSNGGASSYYSSGVAAGGAAAANSGYGGGGGGGGSGYGGQGGYGGAGGGGGPSNGNGYGAGGGGGCGNTSGGNPQTGGGVGSPGFLTIYY